MFQSLPSTLIIFIAFLINHSVPMRVSFCDGKKLVTLKDSQCPGGINFGTKKPDCVCINGIYRLWMDNCVVYDGFMEEGCATLKQDQWTVVGLKMAGRIKHFSNATSAIFAESDSDEASWTAFPMSTQGISTADNFYTIHGDPYVFTQTTGMKSNRFSICVEQKIKKKDEVCRYYREDDENWSAEDGQLELVVRDVCDGPFGSRKIGLKASNCYSVMREPESECSLSCWDRPVSEIDTIIEPESSSLEEYASNKIYRRSNIKRQNAPPEDVQPFFNDSDYEAGQSNDQIQLTFLSSGGDSNDFEKIDEANISSVSITKQMDENNFFLNRKLNHYSKLRQVGYLKPNDLRQISPTRTFELLEVVKNIAKKACPDKFVSSLFIDQAVDLFVILHKGRSYRYIEDLTRGDFEWIKTILAGCLIDTQEIFMYQEESKFSDKCQDFQKVKGVCSSTGENCTDLVVSESHSEVGKYHLVVEAAWDLVDLAQTVCFPSFAQSYRMFHQWEQASEKLFTREIRKLWHNPNLSMKVYQNLLTPSAQVDMYNLEMCVEGAYHSNPALSRLSRPSEPRRFFRRKKRDAKAIDISPQPKSTTKETINVYCRKTDADFDYPTC